MNILKWVWNDFKRKMRDERGFLQTLIPLAISAYSAYNASKGSKNKGGQGDAGAVMPPQPLMPEWQYGLGEDLSGWARQFLSMYEPGEAFGGPLSVTKPTGHEALGLDELGGLLKKPATGELFDAAKGQVMDTLSGKYADPSTSPFIQSFTKLAGQNLQDSINTARGQRGARGTFFTKAGIQEESRLSERTQNMLNALIGEFIGGERGRMVTAADTARSLEGYATDASVKRVTASQTLGALPRLLEQADLERRYSAWLNQRKELQSVPDIGASVFGRNIPQAITTTAPRNTGSDIAPWVTLAMQSLQGGGGQPSGVPSGGGSGGTSDALLKLIPYIVSAFA